jgi:Predicted pPIWI-associating nuclease
MKIEPTILGKHLEAAAIEQLSEELRQEGYEIEREPLLGSTHFRPDLVARRGAETLVIEFKVMGGPEVSLRQAALYARELGARFRLVLIRPEREVHVEVDGLESILLSAISEPIHPDLDILSNRTMVNGVHTVEVDAIRVEQGDIEVRGSALVSVTLTAEGGDVEIASLDFPFTFALRLDADRELLGEPEISIDTSEWNGD